MEYLQSLKRRFEADLQRRFDKSKEYMTEDIGRTPTDKEVYEQLRAQAVQGRKEAIMMDNEELDFHFQDRIKLIDERLKSF